MVKQLYARSLTRSTTINILPFLDTKTFITVSFKIIFNIFKYFRHQLSEISKSGLDA